MKGHRILAIVGYLLIVLGVGPLIYLGFIAEGSGTSSMTIPPGDGYYASFKTESSMWMNAHLEGTVNILGGGTVDVLVLNSAQYQEYSYDLIPSSSIWSSSGSSLEFAVDLPGSGAYYVVANHATGSSSYDQTVTLTYKMSGINLLYVIVGVVMIAVGAALSFVSLRMRKKEGAPIIPQATTSSTEVQIFDSKQKLQ